MIDISKIDYSSLDSPMVTASLFYPRLEWDAPADDETVESIIIPVEKDIAIGARLHMAGAEAATILFFHGNGEIAADYDDLGVVYIDMGMNFLAVDYRGYGRSTGRPTVTAIMRDCHTVFAYIKNHLAKKGYTGPIIVMGRSLGSAPALELAFHYGDEIDGLIIDSGFAYAGPLFGLLGIDMQALGISEEQGFRNLDKIRSLDKPTLVIHAEFDHIIPFSEGQLLFEASPSLHKKFLKVPGANHNDIFSHGLSAYLESVKWLVDKSSDLRQNTILK
jgi:fermentation-respiration switch protein FrsA (DUF1100 family)